MEHPNGEALPRKVGPGMKLAAKLTGVDVKILQECDESDWKSVFAMGELLVLTFIYQSLVFSVVAHQLFSSGEIRFDLIAISVFLAWLVVTIDSWQFYRSSWYSAGVRALKGVGFDIGGGFIARVTAMIALLFRLTLSVALAQLTAIFFGLIVFSSTITSHLHDNWLRANHELITHAAPLIDAAIQRGTADVTAGNGRVNGLAAQVAALRQSEVDPYSSDQRIQQTQHELLQLIGQRAKIDDELRAAETFATNELAGVVGAPGNSGKQGNGPRRKAAAEQVNNLRKHAQDLAKGVEAARKRLDVLRQESMPLDDAGRQRSKSQLTSFEAALDSEKAALATLKSELAKLTNDRESAIRKAVETAPSYVPFEAGLLTRIGELDRIAQENTKVMLVIILIDVCSFGFELAAVLSKLLGNVPFDYATRYTRNVHMRRVMIAEKMGDDLAAIEESRQRRTESKAPEGSSDGSGITGLGPNLNGHEGPNGSALPPVKRGRGRPRKYPPPATNGSGQGTPEE